ncbi:putative repair and recombination protein UvsY [Delftia phage PhiW-14]|uniref:Putative repair and recombination protein UvsY n=1 Tax=Delftia phage PhiW-14 TaxID=665032 RepID=C9DG03_BPW14|nr:UvsY-like recombination mediator [Delftia phage PhiW-14]ACV50054.1 putative repair and recombination protein UvsY [Delftia phage PhiW-14]
MSCGCLITQVCGGKVVNCVRNSQPEGNMSKLEDNSTVLDVIPVTFDEIEAKVNSALECSENFDWEARRNNRIFSMLQRLYHFHTVKLMALQEDREMVKFKRNRYYNGKAPAEEYKKEPLRESILKSDLDQWMKVDHYMVAINKLVAEQDRIVKYLEEAKKLVSERGYLLNTALSHQKLQMGLS